MQEIVLKILNAALSEGGLLRVRALIALTFVVTGAVGLLTGWIGEELAVIIMFSGATPYGIQRASQR